MHLPARYQRGRPFPSLIYYFRNDAAYEHYTGSADCMKRNLEDQVEVLAPVEHPALQTELRTSLDLHFADRCDAWDRQSDGSYTQRQRVAENEVGCQLRLIEKVLQREAKRLKPRVIGHRNATLQTYRH